MSDLSDLSLSLSDCVGPTADSGQTRHRRVYCRNDCRNCRITVGLHVGLLSEQLDYCRTTCSVGIYCSDCRTRALGQMQVGALLLLERSPNALRILTARPCERFTAQENALSRQHACDGSTWGENGLMTYAKAVSSILLHDSKRFRANEIGVPGSALPPISFCTYENQV